MYCWILFANIFLRISAPPKNKLEIGHSDNKVVFQGWQILYLCLNIYDTGTTKHGCNAYNCGKI